jgi:prepilin-type N-terminal cleavage/methylation domain-containing protein
MTRNYFKYGFSLTELSIVLLVIGLIVGGTSASVEIYNNAKIRQTISQLKEYKTAISGFQDKYGYKPGDLPNTATLTGVSDYGDGNGYVAGRTAWGSGFCCNYLPEPRYVFNHLSAGGFVEGSYQTTAISGTISDPSGFGVTTLKIKEYVNVPGSAYTGGVYDYFIMSAIATSGSTINDVILSQPLPEGEAIILGAIGPFYNTEGILTPNQAYLIDSKMDDGLATSGNIFALNGWTAQSDSSSVKCTSNSSTNMDNWANSATYNLTTSASNKVACVLFYGKGLLDWFRNSM